MVTFPTAIEDEAAVVVAVTVDEAFVAIADFDRKASLGAFLFANGEFDCLDVTTGDFDETLGDLDDKLGDLDDTLGDLEDGVEAWDELAGDLRLISSKSIW